MMCSISGSRSVPAGLVGSGRSPAARSTVVVVVLGADDELGELDPFDEHALIASDAAPAPMPVRNVRRLSTTAFLHGDHASAAAFRLARVVAMPRKRSSSLSAHATPVPNLVRNRPIAPGSLTISNDSIAVVPAPFGWRS